MRAIKWLMLMVTGAMLLMMWATPAAHSANSVPMVPTATRPAPMTPLPTPGIGHATVLDGAYIELHIFDAQPAWWTVVQWQDANGVWHAVEGWRGTADDQGNVQWWVSPTDFGTGPFRWAIYARVGGSLMMVSQPFDLPRVARQQVVVEMTNEP